MPGRVVVTWIPAVPGRGDALDIEAFQNVSKLSLPIPLPAEAKVELLDMFTSVVAAQHVEKAMQFWVMLETVMANAFTDEDRMEPIAGADGEPLVPAELLATYHLYRMVMAPALTAMLAQVEDPDPAEPGLVVKTEVDASGFREGAERAIAELEDHGAG